ncbi:MULTISPECIES: flagellin [unclassified Exiguobacterium]|uniref:flagellin N-terminal helical domain-containing protein n=1 Tax=unclassified Exiguobacterium TaxID=2644629 RepID=UPI001BE9E208|nr:MULTISPECIES: flagellin [unclassified Exiguobacterium]
MIINHNLNSMNAHRNMSFNTTQTGKAMEKLSSGLRINRAGDDAAGLAISEKMRGQIRGLDMASKNAQDGISLIQTAEGALSETHDILQRMRELSTQSSNDTNTDADRTEIQKEVNELAKEITRISENTEFNTKNLMGENGFSGKFHIGSNQGQDISLNISDMGAEALGVVKVTPGATATVSAGVSVQGLTTEGYNITVTAASTATGNTATNFGVVVDEDAGTVTITLEQAAGGAGTGAVSTTRQDIADALNATGKFAATTTTGAITATGGAAVPVAAGTATATEGIDVSTQESASRAISVIDNAITKVSAERSKLGATQNRLEHTINNLNVGAENLQAAESRIRDVDMAKEMMNFTKNNILNQAAQAMMAQSNQQPQAVLQLLR